MHFFRFLSVLLVVLLAENFSYAQKPPVPKQKEEKSKEVKPKTDDTKETFGDYVQKVGIGVWVRVKERLNLEETIANLEEKKNKILGDKEKKDEPKEANPKEGTPKQNEVLKPEKKVGS